MGSGCCEGCGKDLGVKVNNWKVWCIGCGAIVLLKGGCVVMSEVIDLREVRP